MAPPRKDAMPENLAGRVFGHFTVLSPIAEPASRRVHPLQWLCRCACSREVVVRRSDLLSGNRVSCGCARRSRVFDQADDDQLLELRERGLTWPQIGELLGRPTKVCYARLQTIGERKQPMTARTDRRLCLKCR